MDFEPNFALKASPVFMASSYDEDAVSLAVYKKNVDSWNNSVVAVAQALGMCPVRWITMRPRPWGGPFA